MTRLGLIALFSGLAAPLAPAAAQWTVVNLHPAGATQSTARGAFGEQQVGSIGQYPGARAGIWGGSAATWVELHPVGATSSEAFDTSGTQQVGRVYVAGQLRATRWAGTAASAVYLHPAAAGPGNSGAFGVSGAVQLGFAETVAMPYGAACRWNGTAASWANLPQPAGAWYSRALAMDGDQIVGYGSSGAYLWVGPAATWVELNPAGATESQATDVSDDKQVGFAVWSGSAQAGVWTGTALSWVSLHPSGATRSLAFGVSHGHQAGMAGVGGQPHASYWAGTAGSWVDLHAFLPPEFTSSVAWGIWSDATTIRIVGEGVNSSTSRTEALLWTRPLGAVCYPNCDGSTTSPVLTANDFTCFLGKYVAGESYANCDGSTGSPTLTANDFTCFLTSFVTGCS